MRSLLETARSAAVILRFLGPWAGNAAPRGVARVVDVLPSGLKVAWYASRRAPRGAYLVAPGLHPLGPDDPRLDRFCRVLAGAGFLVAAPFVRPLGNLRVEKESTDDLTAAFSELCARFPDLPRPAVFSISFGSLPSIELAASDEHRDRVGALLLFGGYADFDATVRFAAGGAADGAGELGRDPLNLPAVFLNLLEHLGAPEHVEALARAWRELVDRTWGQPEMKLPGVRDPIAHAIAQSLPEAARELFLLGAGLGGDPLPVVERALIASREKFAFTDPRPHLAKVRAPIVIVHGREDDVVPWTEAGKLRDAIPPGHPHALHLTGFYGHTGGERPALADLGREAATLARLVHALATAPLDAWQNGRRRALTRQPPCRSPEKSSTLSTTASPPSSRPSRTCRTRCFAVCAARSAQISA